LILRELGEESAGMLDRDGKRMKDQVADRD
jgi:hypothetical protein